MMRVPANTTSFRRHPEGAKRLNPRGARRFFAPLRMTVVAGAIVLPAILGAQGPRRILGVVRDSAGKGIARAEVSVAGDSVTTVANDSGAFALAVNRKGSGTVVVRIRRLGYEPLEQPMTVPAVGDTSTTFTLSPVPQSLAAFHVVAQRTGIWGVVYDQAGVPMPGVQVDLLGAGPKAATTDSSGRFEFQMDNSGTFLLVARKPGYAYAQTSLTMNPHSGEEAEIVLHSLSKSDDVASGFGRMTSVFRETSMRIAFKASAAAVVTRDELLARDRPTLSFALCGTRAQLRAGRCPVQAGCVILNGDRRTALPLDYFEVDDVESVELYPPRSDWSESLAQRGCSERVTTAVVWLRRIIK